MKEATGTSTSNRQCLKYKTGFGDDLKDSIPLQYRGFELSSTVDRTHTNITSSQGCLDLRANERSPNLPRTEYPSILNPIPQDPCEDLKANQELSIFSYLKGCAMADSNNESYNVPSSPAFTPCISRDYSKGTHSNKPYTLEQIHCMQYFFEDCGMTWKAVLEEYLKYFEDPSRGRGEGRLQCRYYRAQQYPLLCIEAKPVFNADGVLMMRKITKRERDRGVFSVPILDEGRLPKTDGDGNIIMRELTKDECEGPLGRALKETLDGYFKFLDRVPEFASQYDWVRPDDKIKGENRARYRREHGIVKSGAVLPGGAVVETVMQYTPKYTK